MFFKRKKPLILPPSVEEEVPTVEIRDAPKKARQLTIWGLVLIGSLLFLVIVSNLAMHGSATTAHGSKMHVWDTKPTAVGTDQITNYSQQEQSEVDQILQQRREAMATLAQDQARLAEMKAAIEAGKKDLAQAQTQQPTDMTQAQIAAMEADAQTRGRQGGSQQAGTQQGKQDKRAGYDSDTIALDLGTLNPGNAPLPSSVPHLVAETRPHVPVKDQRPAVDADQSGDESTGDEQSNKEKVKYEWDTFTGKTHRIFEGYKLEGILVNRLDGEFTGPVTVQLTTNVYSLNLQELLIPRGTVFLGSSRKITDNNQTRLAVSFHRAIMPDGFSVDLNQFKGLDQQGASGLKGKVNRHYARIFGASLAVGVLGGLAQIGNSTTSFGYSPSVSIRSGISQELGQEGETILNRYLNVLPTITIPEGSRVRIELTNDLPNIPEYQNHTVKNDL